jgi:hypothetical protein
LRCLSDNYARCAVDNREASLMEQIDFNGFAAEVRGRDNIVERFTSPSNAE